MAHFKAKNKLPQEHIESIFKEYSTPSRVLRSFTNLSDTVIQTALSGQSKFVLEILQNADDAFEDEHKPIAIEFILQDNYFIVHHNGKGFDYNDVERICDYASQIEEVKATDLSKTGYKGLGFKTLFNLSDCIHIYSNGYSFRFDKMYWPDSERLPWQIIPIWCSYNELPLKEKYHYDKPVNFILKVNNARQLENQLREIVDQPELLLFLHRINKFSINLNARTYFLERRMEKFGVFTKIDFHKNHQLESTWLTKTYERSVPTKVQQLIQGGSRFIYPDKIKKATKVSFTFALQSNEALREIPKIRGLCYSTLPTQLQLTLPYHTNSLFILNLDRTQLHENEWNEFLLCQIGSLQFSLLKDLAEVNYLRNYVIELFVREIKHPYGSFSRAFSTGFEETKYSIGWLPPNQGSRLLALGEAWTDETEFFKQQFQNIREYVISPYLINYDVRGQDRLSSSKNEVKYFTYIELFRDFPKKYYPQLTRWTYIDFISYLYERLKNVYTYSTVMNELRDTPFLRAKDGTLQSPKNALLASYKIPIPDFLLLNPIDNEYLPQSKIDCIMNWLSGLGAKQLTTSIDVLRASVLKWIDSGNFYHKITIRNHIGVLDYILKGFKQLTNQEMGNLRNGLFILTESKQFKLAKSCYLPDATSIRELSEVISNDEKVSSCYDMSVLREFFIQVGVQQEIEPIDVLRKSVLSWIKTGAINHKLTAHNYKPIIEFAALHYPAFEYNLTSSERREFQKMPVLTHDGVFQKAEICYFVSAVPKVKELEVAITRNELVFTENISEKAIEFLIKIGVTQNMHPAVVVRKTILKWIREGIIRGKITLANHHDILKYIGDAWGRIAIELKQEEKTALKVLPILTESNVFRAACACYWSISNFEGSFGKEIPGIKSVISINELVSSQYISDVVKTLLRNLGVHSVTFTNIYDRYSDHLTHPENMKWFFSQLVEYWDHYKNLQNELLSSLQQKFRTSSCLLAKNGKMYSSTELYSSKFHSIHEICPNSVLLLEYTKLPEDLESFLGFKRDLDFECIKKLLEGIDKSTTKLGEKKTLLFFKMLLEQLRLKNKNEVRKNQLRLLSNDNKLKLAKQLYYFIEEDAICFLDSLYLKRICGMLHQETLELAELCGVNILPFNQEITNEEEKYINALQEFYLKRMSFIVAKESKVLNEEVNTTLRRLYSKICTIKLYECKSIDVKYDFGNPAKIPYHFEGSTVYVSGKWVNKKTKIHEYLKKELDLKADISDIIDLESLTQEDKQEWLSFQKIEPREFYFVEEQIKKLMSGEAIDIETSAKSISVTEAPESKYERRTCKDNENLVRKMEEVTASSLDESSLQKTCEITQDIICQDDENLVEKIVEMTASDFSSSGETLKDEASSKQPCEIIPDINCKDDEKLVGKMEEMTAMDFSSSDENLKNEVYLTKSHESTRDIKFVSSDENIKLDKLITSISDEVAQRQHSTYEIESLGDGEILGKKKGKFIEKSSSSDRSFIDHVIDEFFSNKLFSFKKELKKLLSCEERRELDTSTSEESEHVQSCKYEERDFNNSERKRKVRIGNKKEEHLILEYEENNLKDGKMSVKEKEKNIKTESSSDKSFTDHVLDEFFFKQLYSLKEELQKHLSYEGRTLTSVESMNAAQHQTYGYDEEYFKEKIAPAESSTSDGNLDQNEPNLPKPYGVTSEVRGTYINQQKVVKHYETTISCKISEGVINAQTKTNYPRVLQTDGTKPIQTETPASYYCSTENHNAGISTFYGETSSAGDSMKRLNEKFVFTFLQDHYKNKHPNSQINLNNGIFTLQGPSYKIEIVWVNANEEKGQVYDLLIKKDDAVKWLIEVKPSVGNDFNISHSEFITSVSRVTAEFPEYKDKYCVYHIFTKDIYSNVSEKMNNSVALYKVVPLKTG